MSRLNHITMKNSSVNTMARPTLVPSVRDRLLDLGQGNEVGRYAELNSFAWRQLLWKTAMENAISELGQTPYLNQTMISGPSATSPPVRNGRSA